MKEDFCVDIFLFLDGVYVSCYFCVYVVSEVICTFKPLSFLSMEKKENEWYANTMLKVILIAQHIHEGGS